MKRRKSKMGRPPLPAGQARSVKVFFRAEPALYEKLAAAAKGEGKAVGTWIHDTLEALLRSK
jgi:predicted HicB family RNase H-like nuclease